MFLKEVINGYNIEEIVGSSDVEINNLCQDHREVREGSMFFCIKGQNSNGETFVKLARNYGAVCVVCERKLELDLIQVVVKDVREAMSAFACNFYGNPSEKLKLIGVTGTNGKTTTCHLISSIIKNSGRKIGVIGTLGIFYEEKYIPPKLTTPDPIFLNRVLKDMADNGVEYVAMEASAHAISLRKLFGLRFCAKVFTNFTPDHLDFFKTMDEYFKAKISFFDDVKHCFAVYNSDDDRVRNSFIKSGKMSFSFGIKNPSDVFAVNIKETLDGTFFTMNVYDEIVEIFCKLNGLFNVCNCLAASAVCYKLGFDADSIKRGLNAVNAVSGRAERVKNEKNKCVFIDYAHTPDGLKQILSSLRKTTKKRLVCLFGCGGNRDKTKRAVMGEIAGEYADFTVLTSDNPRFEDPDAIINDVEKGLKKKTDNYITCEDRRKAIAYALSYIQDGDVLLIAGKGAEDYQEIMGTKLPFNDKKYVLELLRSEDKN